MNKLQTYAWAFGITFVVLMVANLFEIAFAMMDKQDWTVLSLTSLIFSVPVSIWLNKGE